MQQYPAKVLLYGEHTVLRGGQGLAVPYAKRGLRWERSRPDDRLLALGDYLQETFADGRLLNIAALREWLAAGWQLTGNLPTGYGLGSSGAVCAAVWDRFATPVGKSLPPNDLRAELARMEGFFHGTSSGTDPLICYLGRPVALGAGPPEAVELAAGWQDRFFLVNTGPRVRPAAELIRYFAKRYDAEPGFARAVNAGWRKPADRAIAALRNGDYAELTRATREVSAFQLRNLPNFIPAAYRSHWSGETYRLKLCGAGGGGMLLGVLTAAGGQTEVSRLFGEVEWL